MRLFYIVVLCLVSAVAAFCSAPPQPEYIPYCPSPQQIGQIQPISVGSTGNTAPVVWNGKEFATVWPNWSDNYLHFRRIYADGTPAAAAVTLFEASSYYPPSLVWNGSGYAVAYVLFEGTTETENIYFCRLDAAGNPIGSPVRVSFYGSAPATSSSFPALATSGSGYCVVWVDARTGQLQTYATLLDPTGTVTYHDTILQATSYNQNVPAVAWLSGPQLYQVAWSDYRSGTREEIYSAQLYPSNAVLNTGRFASGSASSAYASFAPTPNGTGMAWVDWSTGDTQIFFATFNNGGYKITSDIQLTTNSGYKMSPVALWTGAEYAVFWYAIVGSSYDIWYQRVSASGTILGSSQQVTTTGCANVPGAAFARHGFLVTAMDCSTNGNFTVPWGCNYPADPGCPSNLIAYGVSGSSSTISWQPAVDNYTDIAYYIVYRNNTEIGKTSNNYYTDTGLGLNTTYNYTVRAVNAAQNMNDPQTCSVTQPQSVYVKTNASFTLMLDKSSDPDAHLYWNDGGMSTYNIFRGTSPQVMSLIGTTSGQSTDDNNVLLDTNNYFYTVDDPGQ